MQYSKYLKFITPLLLIILIVLASGYYHRVTVAEKLLKSELSNHVTIDEFRNGQDALAKKIDQINSLVKRNNPIHDAVASSRTLPVIDRVAHAGGEYNGKTYTNSIDALNANRDKFNIFELDFSETSDGKIVCLHGWTRDELNLGLGGYDEGKVISFAEFKAAAAERRNGWQACTLDELIIWLDKNPGKRIVTDVKDDNIRALTMFKEAYPAYINRFIPQIYDLSEYEKVRDLGYKNIILTLYRMAISDEDLLQAVLGKNFYAITMWDHRTPYLARPLADLGIPVYAHTVNSPDLLKFLKNNYGVSEVYTDNLNQK